jgi:hypothetical protein
LSFDLLDQIKELKIKNSILLKENTELKSQIYNYLNPNTTKVTGIQFKFNPDKEKIA